MLEVVDGGLLTTVQDRGRPDAVQLGVPVGGACDPWSLALANLLVGNQPGAAALEMTLAGATFRALADIAVGVAGAEMAGRIVEAGVAITSGTAAMLRAGQTLAFGAPNAGRGSRTYLALPGGVDVPHVLGSASTCLAGGFGGLEGRALRSGDLIGPADRLAAGRLSDRRPTDAVLLGSRLRVVRGPHLDRLAVGAFDTLVAGDYRVSGRGDRQGIRLDGPSISARSGAPMLSQGVVWGAVQVPPDGQPIVLLADHQTVGGYPVAAVVITADRPRLGQLGPGDEVRFIAVTPIAARLALAEQQSRLGARVVDAQ